MTLDERVRLLEDFQHTLGLILERLNAAYSILVRNDAISVARSKGYVWEAIQLTDGAYDELSITLDSFKEGDADHDHERESQNL